MKMRTRHSTGAPDLSDELSGLYLLANCYIDFFLMIISGINSPTVIDKGCVSSDC